MVEQNGGPQVDGEIFVRTNPLRLKVGEVIYEFIPEMNSDEFLDHYQELQKVRERFVKSDEEKWTPEQIREMTHASREYLSKLMLPESAGEFLEKPPPDRVLMEMSRWIMEQHGGTNRPTSSSSGSSPGRSTGGTSSTARSRSKASSRAGGRRGH